MYIKKTETSDSGKMTVTSELPKYSAQDIKAIRHGLAEKSGCKVTQRTFAFILGVSKRTVESWEDSNSHPSGSARKLLQQVELHPKLVLNSISKH